MTELMLADLEYLEKQLEKSRKLLRSGDAETKAQLELMGRFAQQLGDGKRPEYDLDNPQEVALTRKIGLLSLKPAFICANTDEESFLNFGKDDSSAALLRYAEELQMEVVPVCAKLEEELAQLEAEEAEMFLEELGISENGLTKVIHTGYRLLNYLTFFTAGPMETRAWTVVAGATAPEAAGKIHTDMQRGFIRMETVSYDDMVTYDGWNGAKNAGKLRIEGKEYIVQDGDVIHVRFSV